jgi:hypothetical protein
MHEQNGSRSGGRQTFRYDARHWWRWGHAILKGWERAGGCPKERMYPEDETGDVDAAGGPESTVVWVADDDGRGAGDGPRQGRHGGSD